MYNEFLNNDVTVVVSPRTEQFLEYKGFLESENDETIILKNVSINMALALSRICSHQRWWQGLL